MQNYYAKCVVDSELLDRINKYLEEEPEDYKSCLGEDETITTTVHFSDGKEVDIKCCGVQFQEGESNTAWTEAVLFNENGHQISCTEPDDTYEGIWELSTDEATYTVEVVRG